MAEKKNFTIENYNGTDYDTLYPETNSGQVLLDKTAQTSTNLPSGSTLNDALYTISKDGGGFQIGDTLTTARTNLGNKWLLCNGAQITPSDYPELSSLFTAQKYLFTQTGKNATVSFHTNNYRIGRQNLAYNPITNQLAYSCAQSYGDSYYTALYYLDLSSNSSEWIQVNTIGTGSTANAIECVNGLWVIGNKYYDGALTANTTFSNLQKVNSTTINVTYAIYHNNHYYLRSSNNVYIYTDLSLLPINTISVRGRGINIIPEGICTATVESNTNTVKYYVIADDFTLTDSSWTLSGVSLSSTTSWCWVTYYNGYYYWFIDTGKQEYYLYRSMALDVEPTLFTSLDKPADDYTLGNNDLILSNGNYIDFTNELKSFGTIPSGADVTPIVVTPTVAYQMSGTVPTMNKNPFEMSLYSASITALIKLPTVSVGTGLYTYIKAKN